MAQNDHSVLAAADFNERMIRDAVIHLGTPGTRRSLLGCPYKKVDQFDIFLNVPTEILNHRCQTMIRAEVMALHCRVV
jgi:hypothetical protein